MGTQRNLIEIDRLITDGKIEQATLILRAIDIKKVERRHKALIAKQFRRVSYTEGVLRLLTPLFKNPSFYKPDFSEAVEFSLALNCNNLPSEAQKCLDSFATESHSKIHFYRAAIKITSWSYKEAIVDLESYLQCSLSEYDRLIGQLNLISCYIFIQDFESAQVLMDITEKKLADKNWRLLQTIFWELKIRYLVTKHDWQQALDTISKVQEVFDNTAVVNWDKWQKICLAQKYQDQEILAKLRSQCHLEPEWLRNIDWWSAHMLNEQKQVDHLFYGTPFESFRENIIKDFPISNEYFFGNSKNQFIDLVSGSVNRTPLFRLGSMEHKMLIALSEDFYKPSTIGQLFSRCLPGEFFDITSAPNRIYQIIHKLKMTLKKLDEGFEVSESPIGYQLQIPFNWSIKKNRNALNVNGRESLFANIVTENYGRSAFSTADIMKVCNISRSSARRLVEQLLSAGKVRQVSHGSNARYRLRQEIAS